MQTRKPLNEVQPGEFMVSIPRPGHRPIEIGATLRERVVLKPGQRMIGAKGGAYIVTHEAEGLMLGNGHTVMLNRNSNPTVVIEQPDVW